MCQRNPGREYANRLAAAQETIMDITGQRPRGHHHSGSPDHESRDAEALRTSPSNCRRHVNTQSRQDCRDEKGEAVSASISL